VKALLWILLLWNAAWAGDLPNFISTPRGFTYQNVKVLSHTTDSITISHSGGTTTLAIADLPQEWRDHFKMVDPSAPTVLPSPATGKKTYTVSEIKAHQDQLKGEVVPVLVSYDSATSLETQEDGSFIMFVLAKEGGDFVVFPAAGAASMKLRLQSKSAGAVTLLGLVRPGQPTLVVGREYDAKAKVYRW
jgi:hypothetical protein